MEWNQSFDLTLKTYGVNARQLAQKSGVSEITISRFRKGRQPMNTDNLNALLSALPQKIQNHFFKLLLGEDAFAQPKLEDLIEEMDSQELAKCLRILANRVAVTSLEGVKEKAVL